MAADLPACARYCRGAKWAALVTLLTSVKLDTSQLGASLHVTTSQLLLAWLCARRSYVRSRRAGAC